MNPSTASRALSILFLLAGAAPLVARVEADPPASAGSMAPYLAASRDGGAYATWIEPDAEGHRVRFARYADGAWGAAATVAAGEGLVANWADTPGIVEQGDGVLLAWWLESIPGDAHAYGVRLARSRDGRAWQPLGWLHDDHSASEHGFVSMVAEGRGARAFWLDGRAMPGGGPMSLRTARIGEEVEASRPVDERVCDCCKTAAASGLGGALVAYRDRTETEIRDVSLQRLAGGSGPTSVAADGWEIAGCPVNGPALVTDGDHVAVAWYSAAARRGRVAVAFSEDGGASFAAPLEVDSEAPLGRVALAPGAVGDEVVAGWIGRRGDTGEVRLARVTSAARAEPLAVAATSAGRTSGFPRLVRLGDGTWLLLWTAAGEGETAVRGARFGLSELPPPATADPERGVDSRP